MQTTQQSKGHKASKNNKTLLPIIIGIVSLVIIGIVVAVVIGGKNNEEPSKQDIEECKAADVESCKAIQIAVYNAMGNENIFGLLYNGGNGSTITINPGVSTENGGGITLSVSGEWEEAAKNEIAASLGEKTPKFKYKENNPTHFKVDIDPDCSVRVCIVADKEYAICPELCDEYQ